jgi:hypothetical protein
MVACLPGSECSNGQRTTLLMARGIVGECKEFQREVKNCKAVGVLRSPGHPDCRSSAGSPRHPQPVEIASIVAQSRPWLNFTVVNVFRTNWFPTFPQKLTVDAAPAWGNGRNVTAVRNVVVVSPEPIVVICTMLTNPLTVKGVEGAAPKMTTPLHPLREMAPINNRI